METLALALFVLTYLGVAVGDIPGLVIDRTGIALLGAIAMVACGVLDMQQATLAIDMPTILLLYSLMVVSSQFRLGGFYSHVALAITRYLVRPRQFLLVMMAVSALLSAVLANDIVCLAFTPVLAVSISRAGLNPLPFLLGLAASSNIGSAATIIGNPQNMLIGQVGHLDFAQFLAWCIVPSLLSLGAAYGILLLSFRGAFQAGATRVPASAGTEPEYNRHQSNKGLLVTGLLMVSFFTPIPREISALVAAGIFLCSRKMGTRSLLGLVDWHLITLFCALFIVIKGIEVTHLPEQALVWLAGHGVHLSNPFTLTGVSVVLSNLVSNVPATMVLIKFLDPGDPAAWYVLALSSTFAGNLITIGSIANLIVIEQARECGVTIRFRDHARVGIPITFASLVILAAWIALAR